MKFFKTFFSAFLIATTALYCSAMPIVLGGDSNTASTYLLNPVASGVSSQGNLVGSQTKGWYYKGSTMVSIASPKHEGYSGRGIAYLAARLPSVVKSTKAKICVLNVGANDMWVAVMPISKRVPISDSAALQRASQWVSLANTIESLGCEVVAVMPITPRNASRPLGIFRAKISGWANSHGRVLVDLAGCSNDGVHFKTANSGYPEVARRYVAGIKASATWNGATPPTEPEPPENPDPPVTNVPPVTTSIMLETFVFNGKVVTPPSGPEDWLLRAEPPKYAYNRWICDVYAKNGMILSAMWGNGQASSPPVITGKSCAWAQFVVNNKLDARLNKYGWRYAGGSKYNLVSWPKDIKGKAKVKNP